MSCTNYTLSGINTNCKDSLGGIKEVYIAPYNGIGSVTMNSETHQIDEIEALDGTQFYAFKLRKNTGSMTSTLQVSDTASNYIQTELTLQFMKMETNKRLQIMALLMEECAVIVLDANNKYWYLGLDFPVEASAGTAQSGTAIGDLNGYEITLTDISKELPYEVSPSALASVVDNPLYYPD